MGLFEGTQRGLFSLLFGAGIILLTSRIEKSGKPDAHDIYFRRNMWLILFGVIHAYLLLWSGEILYFYGLTALVLYGFRHMAAKGLIILGIIGLIFGAVWNAWDSNAAFEKFEKAEAAYAAQEAGQTLTREQEDAIGAWQGLVDERKPGEFAIQKEIKGHKGNYLEVLLTIAPTSAHFESWYFYRYFFDIAAMMLIGMALFKTGFLTLKARTGVYLGIMVAGYAVGLSTNYYEITSIMAGNFSILSFMHADITYDLGRLGMTVGHVGFLLLFCKSGILGWLQKALAAVGQMALTNYVSHSIICAFVFTGIGFGLYGELSRYELYYVVFAIWIFQLIVSPMWLKYYRFGPLEWGWRSLTYMKKQPMKR